MTTVSTPHSINQSTSRCRSAVKVPKLRTGSGARSALTAAMCIVAPTPMAAAFGLTMGIMRLTLDFDSVAIHLHSSCCRERKGWAAQFVRFLDGIAGRRHHSQVRNSPWTRFFNGVTCHQNYRPLPSDRSLAATRYYATRGEQAPQSVFYEPDQPIRP